MQPTLRRSPPTADQPAKPKVTKLSQGGGPRWERECCLADRQLCLWWNLDWYLTVFCCKNRRCNEEKINKYKMFPIAFPQWRTQDRWFTVWIYACCSTHSVYKRKTICLSLTILKTAEFFFCVHITLIYSLTANKRQTGPKGRDADDKKQRSPNRITLGNFRLYGTQLKCFQWLEDK